MANLCVAPPGDILLANGQTLIREAYRTKQQLRLQDEHECFPPHPFPYCRSGYLGEPGVKVSIPLLPGMSKAISDHYTTNDRQSLFWVPDGRIKGTDDANSFICMNDKSYSDEELKKSHWRATVPTDDLPDYIVEVDEARLQGLLQKTIIAKKEYIPLTPNAEQQVRMEPGDILLPNNKILQREAYITTQSLNTGCHPPHPINLPTGKNSLIQNAGLKFVVEYEGRTSYFISNNRGSLFWVFDNSNDTASYVLIYDNALLPNSHNSTRPSRLFRPVLLSDGLPDTISMVDQGSLE